MVAFQDLNALRNIAPYFSEQAENRISEYLPDTRPVLQPGQAEIINPYVSQPVERLYREPDVEQQWEFLRGQLNKDKGQFTQAAQQEIQQLNSLADGLKKSVGERISPAEYKSHLSTLYRRATDYPWDAHKETPEIHTDEEGLIRKKNKDGGTDIVGLSYDRYKGSLRKEELEGIGTVWSHEVIDDGVVKREFVDINKINPQRNDEEKEFQAFTKKVDAQYEAMVTAHMANPANYVTRKDGKQEYQPFDPKELREQARNATKLMYDDDRQAFNAYRLSPQEVGIRSLEDVTSKTPTEMMRQQRKAFALQAYDQNIQQQEQLRQEEEQLELQEKLLAAKKEEDRAKMIIQNMEKVPELLQSYQNPVPVTKENLADAPDNSFVVVPNGEVLWKIGGRIVREKTWKRWMQEPENKKIVERAKKQSRLGKLRESFERPFGGGRI